MVREFEVWKELSERSRWYTSQLWYVPFAYFGMIGIALDDIERLAQPSRSIAFAVSAMFSLAVIVHVLSVSFYEQRAVARMRRLETEDTSLGDAPWWISFPTYIVVSLVFCSYAFAWMAAQGIALLVLTLVLILIICAHGRRCNDERTSERSRDLQSFSLQFTENVTGRTPRMPNRIRPREKSRLRST